MKPVKFKTAIRDKNLCTTFVISPGCTTENRGILYDGRVEKNSVPNGWYAYDVRHGDGGYPCTVEKDPVIVNFYGTFLTEKPIRFKSGRDFICLRGRGGYTYEE